MRFAEIGLRPLIFFGPTEAAHGQGPSPFGPKRRENVVSVSSTALPNLTEALLSPLLSVSSVPDLGVRKKFADVLCHAWEGQRG
jgi:hypothetical protein